MLLCIHSVITFDFLNVIQFYTQCLILKPLPFSGLRCHTGVHLLFLLVQPDSTGDGRPWQQRFPCHSFVLCWWAPLHPRLSTGLSDCSDCHRGCHIRYIQFGQGLCKHTVVQYYTACIQLLQSRDLGMHCLSHPKKALFLRTLKLVLTMLII